MRQESFSMTGYFDKGKKTKRERFLGEMEQVLPWVRLLVLIEPYYPKGSSAGGRPPLPLERMFRIYCLQQWYNLSDPGAEEALYRDWAGEGVFRVSVGLEDADELIADLEQALG